MRGLDLAENPPGEGAVNPDHAAVPSQGGSQAMAVPVLSLEEMSRLRAADFQQLRRVASLPQVAELTGLTPEAVQQAALQAGLPVHYILGTPLLFRDELQAWAETPADSEA